MKTHTQSLPGIKSIAFVDAGAITPNAMLKAISNVPVAVYSEVIDVPFFGTPTCTVTDEYDSHGRQQSVTLKFSTSDYIPTHMPLAFVVTDMAGKAYLIGAKEPPHAAVKLTIDFGTPSGEAACSLYEVSLSAKRALLECSAASGE